MVADDAVCQVHVEPVGSVAAREIEILAVEEVARVEAAELGEFPLADEEQRRGCPRVGGRASRAGRPLELSGYEMRPGLAKQDPPPREIRKDLMPRSGA